MRVGDAFGQYDDDRIVTDVAAAPRDLAVRIEHDAISGRVVPGKPGLPRVMSVGAMRIGLALGVFLAGDAADEPGVNRQPLVQPLEHLSSARVFRPPSAGQPTPMDARD